MKHRNNLFYILIFIFLIGISLGYALINKSLSITGTSEVKSNSWDIYFDNVIITPGSVSTVNAPTIDNINYVVNFDVFLNLPGDFYEFTVDVVNFGTIDAMIESFVKTPELTEEQNKYLKYIVEYQNGDEIDVKQVISKGSFIRIKVRVEYIFDISENELPIVSQNLNLGFSLNYLQADNNSEIVRNNGLSVFEIISGDGTNVGDEICLDTECFYVISSSDTEIKMLSKYNLLVGDLYYTNSILPIENATGIQNINSKGWFLDCGINNPMIGVKGFSGNSYWGTLVKEYPSYVYDNNSYIYIHIKNYKEYLERFDIEIKEARLIKLEELESLGCKKNEEGCINAPSFVYSTTYWTGDAYTYDYIWKVGCNLNHNCSSSSLWGNHYSNLENGVRPVIVISKDLIKK